MLSKDKRTDLLTHLLRREAGARRPNERAPHSRPAEAMNLAFDLGRAWFRRVPQALDRDFCADGGETGHRTRLHNWAALGALFDCPMPLRVALSLCVKTQFPVITRHTLHPKHAKKHRPFRSIGHSKHSPRPRQRFTS